MPQWDFFSKCKSELLVAGTQGQISDTCLATRTIAYPVVLGTAELAQGLTSHLLLRIRGSHLQLPLDEVLGYVAIVILLQPCRPIIVRNACSHDRDERP